MGSACSLNHISQNTINSSAASASSPWSENSLGSLIPTWLHKRAIQRENPPSAPTYIYVTSRTVLYPDKNCRNEFPGSRPVYRRDQFDAFSRHGTRKFSPICTGLGVLFAVRGKAWLIRVESRGCLWTNRCEWNWIKCFEHDGPSSISFSWKDAKYLFYGINRETYFTRMLNAESELVAHIFIKGTIRNKRFHWKHRFLENTSKIRWIELSRNNSGTQVPCRVRVHESRSVHFKAAPALSKV